MEIWHLLLVSLGINLVAFVPAYLFKTDKLTDLMYGITFVVLAIYSFIKSNQTDAKILLLILIILWAIRLGTYLFIRINKMKRDKRFDEIRVNPLKFLMFWIFQAVVAWLIMIPSIYFFSIEINKINYILLLGLIIWLLGFLMEAIADYQKYKFKLKSNKWCDVGLWKYSRHPNYLGEMLCWIGIYVFTFSSLATNQSLISLLSPLCIIVILLFVSGIPMLEKRYEKKYGKDKEYQEYKRKTPKLIPFLF